MINSYHSIGRRALALALSVLLAVSTLSTQTFTVSASDADSGTEYGGWIRTIIPQTPTMPHRSAPCPGATLF